MIIHNSVTDAVQLGTDCKLELTIGTSSDNSEYCDTVWRSSACTDSGTLWVSLHCWFLFLNVHLLMQ